MTTSVVFTDGLVERRGADTEDAIARLRSFVGTAFPGATTQRVVEHMLGIGGQATTPASPASRERVLFRRWTIPASGLLKLSEKPA